MGGIVIVGAGQAGASVAAKLRSLGYGGTITMIGEESIPPYQRPPLSKGYLLGEFQLERLYLRTPSFWDKLGVDMRLGVPVNTINRSAKMVLLGNDTIPYDQLVLATGSRPLPLPAAIGGNCSNVYYLRTIADVDAMAPEFSAGRRLLIVGGGYVGLEVAAVSAKLGLSVTVVELAPRILQRVAAPETSDHLRKVHVANGVKLLEGIGLMSLTGADRVSVAVLSDGSELMVDFVIVGVGITPEIFLAEKAGLKIENGICTDEFGRTSDPAIWAAGDCASFPYHGSRVRLESVGNAIDQAETVAENMLGAGKAYEAKAWFWSDQYDIKLQIAGLNSGYDRIVTRKSEGGGISFWYFRGDTLLAVDAMNDARAYVIGKRLIDAGKSPDPKLIACASTDLRLL